MEALNGSHCKATLRYIFWIVIVLAGLLMIYSLPPFRDVALAAPSAASTHLVYDDNLHWYNWSWQTSVDPNTTWPVFGGRRSMAVTFDGAWAGLSLHYPGFNTSSHSSLSFYIRTSGQPLSAISVSLYNAGDALINQVNPQPYATPANDGWHQVNIPLADLGGANTTITRVQFQEDTGSAQPTFYLDNLEFAGGNGPAESPSATGSPAEGPSSTGAPAESPSSTGAPKYIALTFDDGPSSMTKEILDHLAARGVRATMFVTGEKASENPDAIRRMVNEGHAIGNHSWNHSDLTSLSLTAAIDQLSRTNKALTDLGAPAPHLFRPPFGKTNGEMAKIVEDMGMTQTLWSLDAHDWSPPGPSADQLCRNVVGGASSGGVVLMHDLDFNTSTPEAINCIIDTLRSQGFEFGRIASSSGWDDAVGSNISVVPW